jgi:hypothetical protein
MAFWAGLPMINAKLREFDCDVIAKGQIAYGDVRRLQRDYLPGGIASREELELLVSLNAKVVRADKAWAQWLVASVAEFVAKREAREHPIEEAAGECVGRLFAASTTSLGRRIARQVRRELGRRQGIQSTNSDQPSHKGGRSNGIQQPAQSGEPENDQDKCSLQVAKPPRRDPDKSPARSRPHRRPVRHKKIPRATTLARAAHHSCPAGYLPAVQRSHLMNFQNARISLVLAPCL